MRHQNKDEIRKYGNKPYWKVKAKVSDKKTIVFWASCKRIKGNVITYKKCNKEGGKIWKGNVEQIELIIGSLKDVIWERKARVSLRYGDLEII